MKKFLLKTVLFLFVAFVLAFCLDHLICRGLLGMEDYRFQDYRAMLDGGMDNAVLIMGNSRGKSHFDTYLIDSICNTSSFCIGIGGYPINVQVSKYNIYRAHNTKPKLIIQNVDYATVLEKDNVIHQHQSEQFFPLIYDRQGRRELKGLGYGFLELYVPLFRFYGYQQVIKNGLLEGLGLKHYVSRPAYKGHRPEDGEWNGSELARMEKQSVELLPEAMNTFEDYLKKCRADSIDVVLVYSPMYFGAMEKLEGLEEARDYFQRVALRYDCVYLDYLDNCPICKDTSNFCVSVHMNPKATKEFTTLFCDDLKRLSLIPD